MENPTPDLTGKADAGKSPEEIEREMAQTREAITQKAALLECQVKDTLHSVTGTVEAVKEAVASAPSTVSETVKQTVESVKETVKETVRSIDIAGCIRDNPWAAVGTSTLGGFVIGLLLGSARSRPIMARGHDEPAPRGRAGVADGYGVAASAPAAPASSSGGGWQMPGFVQDLIDKATRELREVAESALSSATAALKQNVNTLVPGLVGDAVHRVADSVTPRGDGACPTGAAAGTTRVHGPGYSARS